MSKNFAVFLLLIVVGCSRNEDAITRVDIPVTIISNRASLKSFEAKPETKPEVELAGITLYQTSDLMANRCPDSDDLVDYIDSLKSMTINLFAVLDRTTAKGINIGVGIKPNGDRHVWCEGVGNSLDSDLCDELAAQLAEIEACSVKNGPIAFSLVFAFDDQEIDSEVPLKSWNDAIQKHENEVSIPDGLFSLIWPTLAKETVQEQVDQEEVSNENLKEREADQKEADPAKNKPDDADVA